MKLHQIPRQMKNFFIFYFFGRKYIMSKFILLRTIYDSINKKKNYKFYQRFIALIILSAILTEILQ